MESREKNIFLRALPLRGGVGINGRPLTNKDLNFFDDEVPTVKSLRGGGKALMARQLRNFFPSSLRDTAL